MNVIDIPTSEGVCSVEWITGILRFHGHGTAGFGSPSSFSLTMLVHGHQAIFLAAEDAYTPATRRAVKEAMAEIGINRVDYERGQSEALPARKKVLLAATGPHTPEILFSIKQAMDALSIPYRIVEVDELKSSVLDVAA